MLPIPEKLLRAGVTDVVRISDARMSGTGFGTVVLHTAPEAAVGGPIAAVATGDEITLDVDAGQLHLDVAPEEIERRLRARRPARPRPRRGYGALYAEHVLHADEGCDFDFLRAVPGEPVHRMPSGLISGWIGGW
jgi:dihydroxy-acid dehydratase